MPSEEKKETKKTTTTKKTVKAKTTKKTTRKATTRKTTVKTVAPEEKKPVKKPLTAAQYAEKIIDKKKEAHDKSWLYIEVKAGDLHHECEPELTNFENLEAVCTAMTDELLEGDCFVVDTFGTSPELTVRYYVDNLSPDRRKYYDVNK